MSAPSKSCRRTQKQPQCMISRRIAGIRRHSPAQHGLRLAVQSLIAIEIGQIDHQGGRAGIQTKPGAIGGLSGYLAVQRWIFRALD